MHINDVIRFYRGEAPKVFEMCVSAYNLGVEDAKTDTRGAKSRLPAHLGFEGTTMDMPEPLVTLALTAYMAGQDEGDQSKNRCVPVRQPDGKIALLRADMHMLSLMNLSDEEAAKILDEAYPNAKENTLEYLGELEYRARIWERIIELVKREFPDSFFTHAATWVKAPG